MEQKVVQLDSEKFSCSICRDLLKEPVTIPCGHSYCMNCIQTCWDEDGGMKTGIHRCPQCRQTFTPRPVLVKNFMFAEMVEELKKSGLQVAAADHCYAGPEDVACDVCSGGKLKATKSCLVCLASYCEKHLQPHYDAAPLKKHKLVEPFKMLQENFCSRHHELMEMFCCTDQQSICFFCTKDEHKGHETVPAAVERAKKQKELEVSQRNIQHRIKEQENNEKLLQQQVEAINVSADKAVDHSKKIFTKLVWLLHKLSSDVEQEVRSQQEREVMLVGELQEKLEQEMAELKRKDAEMKQLSHTEDHNQFLHNYPSVSALSCCLAVGSHLESALLPPTVLFWENCILASTHSPSIHVGPQSYFENVTAAVSESRDKLQDILREMWTNILLRVTEEGVLLSPPEPKTRAEFLQYYREITLDRNTAHTNMLLSEGNRKATLMFKGQCYFNHPDRFTVWRQVLGRQSLTGRCYWEVEWRGEGVYVAVAYKNISRAGWSDECLFGFNDKSWALCSGTTSFEFVYNKVKTTISGPQSSRVGVYLDHRAGVLSFYSVAESMTLLHRIHTTFTEPLYAGVHFCDLHGYSAEFVKVK